jgi:hypothetical protein
MFTHNEPSMIDTDDMIERLPHHLRYLSDGTSVSNLFTMIIIGDLDGLKSIPYIDDFQIHDMCLELAITCNHTNIVQYFIYTYKMRVYGYIYVLAIRNCPLNMFVMIFEHASVKLLSKDLDPSPFNNYNYYKDDIREIIHDAYCNSRLDIIKYMINQSKADNEDSFIRIVDTLLSYRTDSKIDEWMKQYMVDNAECIIKYNMNRYVNRELISTVNLYQP